MPTKITILFASIALLVASSLALAADPVWMVVTTDAESVRCGDQEIYYTIAEFNKGTMVAIDDTSGDYSKLRYPATLGAVVSTSQVRLVKAGSRVVLLESAQLKAVSMLRGIDGSWCPVYAEPLAANTEMMVLETLRDADGEIQGFRVAPPRPPVVESYPYAYVRTASLRPATPAEIKRHQGGKQITTGRHPLTKATPKQIPNPEAAEDISEQIQTDSEPAIVDLRQEMVIPEIKPETEPEANPEPVEIVNTIPAVQPKPVISPEKTTRRPLTKITAASLEALEASFTNARSMPRAELDNALPELLAEFTRTRNALGDDDSETRAIDQRIEWIIIRIQTRDQRRAIAQALAAADSQSLALNRKMDQWNASRVYTLVGRLMLSGVYTGEHLPLMYRVQAPDSVTGLEHTIGYIAPNNDQDFRHYLGTVVGVIGTPVHDDALALTVLTPTRIDTMPGQ